MRQSKSVVHSRILQQWGDTGLLDRDCQLLNITRDDQKPMHLNNDHHLYLMHSSREQLNYLSRQRSLERSNGLYQAPNFSLKLLMCHYNLIFYEYCLESHVVARWWAVNRQSWLALVLPHKIERKVHQKDQTRGQCLINYFLPKRPVRHFQSYYCSSWTKSCPDTFTDVGYLLVTVTLTPGRNLQMCLSRVTEERLSSSIHSCCFPF